MIVIVIEQVVFSFAGLGSKYNLLSNENLIIHNLTKFDDNRSYACVIQNQINNQTKTSRFKTLRVRGNDRKLDAFFFFNRKVVL